MLTEKQKIVNILKENKIKARVKISENRIDIKNQNDMVEVSKLFPTMTISYGFY